MSCETKTNCFIHINVLTHLWLCLKTALREKQHKRRKLPSCTELTITIKVTTHLSHFPALWVYSVLHIIVSNKTIRITFLFKNAVILERARLVGIKYLLDVRDHTAERLMQKLCGLSSENISKTTFGFLLKRITVKDKCSVATALCGSEFHIAFKINCFTCVFFNNIIYTYKNKKYWQMYFIF